MTNKDNRDLSFLPIINQSPNFLSKKDIEKYNTDGFISPINAFSNKEAEDIRKKVDGLFDTLKSYEDGRDLSLIHI